MALRKYRVRCVTESVYYFVVDTVVPTECPVNSGHTLDTDATVVVIEYGTDTNTWVFVDQKTTAVHGGTALDDTWIQRDLNTMLEDGGSDVTLGTNDFTINTEGRYSVQIQAPAFKVKSHMCRLYDSTNAQVIATGDTTYTYKTATPATLYCFLEVASVPVTYRVEHYCSQNNYYDGFGQAIGIPGVPEQYTQVVVAKL